MIFSDYVLQTKRFYFDRYSKNPKFKSFNGLTSEIQECMLRCGIEARYFQLHDNVDDIVILAQCVLIRERLRRTNY